MHAVRPATCADEYPQVNGSAPETAPPAMLREAIYRISLGSPLPPGLLTGSLTELLGLKSFTKDHLLASLMSGLMARGPIESEVTELVRAALLLDTVAPATPRDHGVQGLVVLAGSGKKGLKTFNISTSSAIVAAAGGASVIKVGSYATSSIMGSRDFASRMGLRHSRTSGAALSAVRRHGFAFVPVEETIPTLDSVYGGRFHVLTPFGFGLAGLASPVVGDKLVFGLSHPRVDLAASVLRQLGIRDAVVVGSQSRAGYFSDELGVGDSSLLCELRDGEVGETRFLPAEAMPGARAVRRGELSAPETPDEALRWAVEALRGRGNPQHVHVVALNAALVLRAAGCAADLEEGYERARRVIMDGQVAEKLAELRGNRS
ncbi:anthranilate phosphoribosyltransferase [Nocardiopsis sp. NPDC006938]|uniref:anthranilate phosphoribosyltransferase n=1 Tax=Nocardiopsis sp. NPDC006938 TaxID=3364337 RepID=UPI0036B6F7CE